MTIKKGYCLLILIFFSKNLFSQNYKLFSTFENHESGITVMTKDPGNKFLIAGDKKGNLYFHDFKTGNFIKSIAAHQSPVSLLQFNSNGRLLISATEDGEIKIYDFDKEKIIQSIYSNNYSGIHFVLFSIADGFIYFNGNKKLYKTRSDLTQPVMEIAYENDTITDAVITSDRSSLIYSCGSIIKVMDTRTDIPRQEFNSGVSKIQKIALVKDTLLATWSLDGTIYFWHYILGQINPVPVFFLKAGNPTRMSFSEDGIYMCSGNIGNWARIWKPMQRSIVQELFAHSGTVTSTCFGKGSDELFTGSLDGKIILWKKDSIAAKDSIASSSVNIKLVTNRTDEKTEMKTSPDVIITDANVPKMLSGRNVKSDMTVEVTSSILTISVYDNSYLDGDTMSLYFNGEWILDHYGVTKKKQPVTLNFIPNTNNYLILFANNIGKTPPNTAVIEFNDGKSKKIIRLSSDLKTCSSINFFYKK
jgi:WD40 repeat protein